MPVKRTILQEYTYPFRPVEQGYANRTLYLNLNDMSMSIRPVSDEMKQVFTGGRGFALWLLWNAIKDNTQWDDEQNELIFANGPICGITAYPGSGKSTVVTLSPLTKSVIDSNSGGYFAPYLKFSGFDALEIQGKAKEDLVIFIDGDTGRISFETIDLRSLDTHILINELAETYADDVRGKLAISTVTSGQAANFVNFSALNISWYDLRRKEMRIKQAARGGAGRVFRDKNLQAIVIKYSSLRGDSNNPVNMDLIRKAGKRINKEIAELDDVQNQMRKLGTANLVDVMNHFDLLPTHNYRYGAHPEAAKIGNEIWLKSFTQGLPDGCWVGCTMSCAHAVDHFHLDSGPYKGQAVMVDGPEYESAAGLGSNIGNFDPHAILELNFYADTYGIDTITLANSFAFVIECYESGVITTEQTGGLELNWGNAQAALTLLHQMASGEGFGKIVGLGVRGMKKFFAENFGADAAFLNDIGMEVKGMEISEYVTKESLAQQGGYGMAVKGAQHDEAWLIFIDQVNNQIPTFADKAEALHYFPLWRTWFSLHGLCKLPWNDILPKDNAKTETPSKVPEHVENYTWIYEGLSGKKTTPQDLLDQSERVYNFQRVFTLRTGFGTRQHDHPPYRAMGPVTEDEYESRQERYDEHLRTKVGIDPSAMTTKEKVACLRAYREDQYEQLMNAVYKRRGWDNNGVPTLETLERLGINFPEVNAVVQKAITKSY